MSNRVSAQLYALAGCPPAEALPEADLLAAHVAGDPDALAAILERHGPSVWRVCRAHLSPCDADDAFQATVLVFLRDARRIRDARNLSGWLVRVAHLVCLKARRDAGRRRLTPLAADPPGNARDPAADAEAGDLSAAVCAELARLPSKLRAVLVLCVMEDRSNAEAARVLNVPRGTVDSRLFHAKARLKTGLTRRGLAPAAAALLAPTAVPGAAAAAARLVSALPRLSAATPAVLTLVHGVSTTMSLVKLATASVLAAGLIGTAGWGVIRTQARDDAPPKEQPAKPADKPPAAKPPEKLAEKPTDPPAASERKPEVGPTGPVFSQNEKAARVALAKPFAGSSNFGGLTYDALFTQIAEQHGLVIRFDVAAIARFYPAGMGGAETVRDQLLVGGNPGTLKVNGLINPSGTVAEVLADLTACLPGRMTYRVRGNRILITPAYIPPSRSVEEVEADGTAGFARHYLAEQTLGPPVSVSFAAQPLSKSIEELRAQTGANIVLHHLNKESRDTLISATLDDVRLLNALEVIADLSGAEVVLVGSVYYIVMPENAVRLRETTGKQVKDKLPAVPTPQPMG